MNCYEAHQGLLEADLAELNGEGDDPLARHLAECPACRSMADMVLADELVLGEGLIAHVPPPDIDRLVDEVLGSAPASRLRTVPANVRRAALALVPLAAAATMAALLLRGGPSLPGEPYHAPADFHTEAPGLAVETAQGQDVAILATNNPEITVLWFF